MTSERRQEIPTSNFSSHTIPSQLGTVLVTVGQGVERAESASQRLSWRVDMYERPPG